MSDTHPDPNIMTLGGIRALYNSGSLRSRQAAVEIARLFPCLRSLYPPDYKHEDWWPESLATAARKMSEGEAACAQFVLLIYNWQPMTDPKSYAKSKWKCGMFNIANAASHWGKEEKRIFDEWFQNPFFL